jgi:hypothetical protein
VWDTSQGVFLIGLIVAPALAGIVVGARARDLSQSRLGTAGIVVNFIDRGLPGACIGRGPRVRLTAERAITSVITLMRERAPGDT